MSGESIRPLTFLETYPLDGSETHGREGRTYATRKHISYALPFVHAFGGNTIGAVHGGMVPRFACPLCRMAVSLGGDAMAEMLKPECPFAFSYEWTEESFGLAVARAAKHMAGHGVAAEWHSVDVMTKFPGTAFGAVILRGLDAVPPRPGFTRVVADTMRITFRDEKPVEVLFAEARPSRHAIVADVETFAVEHIPSPTDTADDVRLVDVRFDEPLTIDVVAVTEREQIAAANVDALAHVETVHEAIAAEVEKWTPTVTLNISQARQLVEAFGGEDAEVALTLGEGHAGYGLYAHFVGVEDEGAIFLQREEEATLDMPAEGDAK